MEGVACNQCFIYWCSTCLRIVGLPPSLFLSLSLYLSSYLYLHLFPSLSMHLSQCVCLSMCLCFAGLMHVPSQLRLAPICYFFKTHYVLTSIYYNLPSMSLNPQSQVHTEIKYRLQRFSFGKGSASLKVPTLIPKFGTRN